VANTISELTIYELNNSELDEARTFRNSMFTPVDPDQWRVMNCTAVIAREGEKLVGCIPLQFRQQVLRPGVVIPVVYENAVGVLNEVQGKGIGTRMLDAAADFMADRVDALMVLRGGEREAGYRFYRKTGHGDVLHSVDYILPKENVIPQVNGCEVLKVSREDWLRDISLVNLPANVFAGGRPREAGYWNMILDSHVFKHHGWELFIARRNGRPVGYLLGVHGTWSDKDDLVVFEAAGSDTDTTVSLLSAAQDLSRSGTLRLRMISLSNPIRETLDGLGGISGETTPQLMARILNPERIFKRLADGTDFAERVSVSVVTPHRTVVLSNPENPRFHVRLELKEAFLSRLLMCRLSFGAALDMELLRWAHRDAGIERELQEIFKFNEWVQWFSDYV
jgi:GNAT superfamily N-acetyltransferase